MVDHREVLTAVHKRCIDKLIPEGISPSHPEDTHFFTSLIYVNAVNDRGLDLTAEQVVEAIIGAAGWDEQGAWPGHPSVDKFLRYVAERNGFPPVS